MKSGSLRRLAAHARTDSEGSALVEFGLICPLLLTIYFGVVVTTPGFDLDRKVTIATRTAADLTARAATMSCADVNATLTTAAAMLQPNDPTGTTLAVANVAVTNISTTSTPNLQAKVQWSQARSVTNSAGAQAVRTVPTGWAVNSIVTPIPAGFAVAGTTFVMANVAKNYVPPLATRLVGTVALTHSLNWPARTPTATVWTGATLC
jgi:Flp pilus assembly protein TadG